MKNKTLTILKSYAYSIEKYGRKYIADYQFERVAKELAEFVAECVEDIIDAKIAIADNVDWATLDPVKWEGVKPSRKYIVFDDEKDSEINITP